GPPDRSRREARCSFVVLASSKDRVQIVTLEWPRRSLTCAQAALDRATNRDLLMEEALGHPVPEEAVLGPRLAANELERADRAAVRRAGDASMTEAGRW